MKGKLFLFLFALPFFGVGLWMGYSAGSNLADAWQMKQWVAVQGTLHRAGYETHDVVAPNCTPIVTETASHPVYKIVVTLTCNGDQLPCEDSTR